MYAEVKDVEAGFRALTEAEKSKAQQLLSEAEVMIDASAQTVEADRKKLVACRMVRRAIGDGGSSAFPMGATQGSLSALGYSQSWTIGNGSSGELYFDRQDKKLLGIGNRISAASPLERMVQND